MVGLWFFFANRSLSGRSMWKDQRFQVRNGLDEKEVQLSDPSILDIVRHYTREAGVRGLERQIAKIFRKL